PSIAMASWIENRSSTVTTLPPCRIRSASAAWAKDWSKVGRTQVKARRASKRRLDVAADARWGNRIAGFQVGASFCKSVPSNLRATLALTLTLSLREREQLSPRPGKFERARGFAATS